MQTNSIRTLIGLILAFAVIAIASLTVGALSRGYNSEDPGIRAGMALVLEGNSSNVERASTQTSGQFVGVAKRADDSSVAISSGDKQILVQTDGITEALVSDINGEIQEGDLLAISPLQGVLVKSVQSGARAVAVAVERADFGQSETATIEGVNGPQEVKITEVKANLDTKAVAAARSTEPERSTLEKLGEQLTGKQVSESRVILGIVLFLVVLIVEGSIIYGATSSSITSLGRNPMARKFIQKDLARIAFVSVVVLVIGLGALYVILWL